MSKLIVGERVVVSEVICLSTEVWTAFYAGPNNYGREACYRNTPDSYICETKGFIRSLRSVLAENSNITKFYGNDGVTYEGVKLVDVVDDGDYTTYVVETATGERVEGGSYRNRGNVRVA